MELLAPSLQGRVDYFLTRYHEVHNAYGRACIMVDDTEAIYFSWVEMYEQEMNNYDEAHLPLWANDATFCDQAFINALTTYRSLSIAGALTHKDFIVRVLAILDRRVGKRTLQRLVQEDDWNGFPPGRGMERKELSFALHQRNAEAASLGWFAVSCFAVIE